jgi:hypothetical protein
MEFASHCGSHPRRRFDRLRLGYGDDGLHGIQPPIRIDLPSPPMAIILLHLLLYLHLHFPFRVRDRKNRSNGRPIRQLLGMGSMLYRPIGFQKRRSSEHPHLRFAATRQLPSLVYRCIQRFLSRYRRIPYLRHLLAHV